MTYIKKVLAQYDDSPNLDAFGRLRVSQPSELYSAKHLYGLEPDRWLTQTSGAGTITYLGNEAAAQLSVGTGANDSAIMQSNEYLHYVPGKSQLITLTGSFNAKEPATKRIGYFDANNGLFFELSGGVINVVIRSSASGAVSETRIPQNKWNLDTLDGNGPSKLVLDPTKLHIFSIDFQWLGSGRVRFGFTLNGAIVYVHSASYSNSGTGVYMATANLPVRYEISNTGPTTTSSTLKKICTSVASESGQTPLGKEFAISNGITLSAFTSRGVLLGIQMMPQFQGKSNRKIAELLGVELYATTNDLFWELVHCQGCTITGTFSAVNSSLSVMQYSTNISAISGGLQKTIDSGFAMASQKNAPVLPASPIANFKSLYRRLAQNINSDNGDAMLLYVTPFTGTTNATAHLSWVETN